MLGNANSELGPLSSEGDRTKVQHIQIPGPSDWGWQQRCRLA